VSKVFGGTIALHGVSLAMRAGEVHALVGENGAGKSTLTRIMCGVHAPSKGQVMLDGTPVTLGSPAQAQANGIWIMHQEPSLFPHLDVAENVFCGRQPLRAGTPMIDR